MEYQTVDTLIIGSGFGAVAPALRLCEAGAEVLMLEKGPDIVPERDFKQTQDPRYLLKYIKGVGGENVHFTFVEGLGGGSGFYELVSLRAPSQAFCQTAPNGDALWPAGLNRATFDPYYDTAEKMLNISQVSVADLPQSGVIFSKLMKNLGYTCDRAPYAVKGCRSDGYCATGCVFGAKQSLHTNYLPRARRAGLKIRTDCEALTIRPLRQSVAVKVEKTPLSGLPLRYEVKCRDRVTGKTSRIRTKLLVLAGGTVGTAQLLFDSAEDLPELSDQVGRNIATNGSVKAAGLIPESFPDADMCRGRSHPGVISYEFLESRGITISSNKPLPLYIVAAARLVAAGELRQPDYWGQAHLDLMQKYRRRMIAVYALGLTAPNAELRRQANGKVVPHLDLDDDTRKYCRDTRELIDSIFSRNGGTVLRPSFVDREGQPHGDLYLSTGHMLGSARMASSGNSGVCDSRGEVFAYPGLVITDGAALPTSLAVNTSLTILANAERIADHLLRQYVS
jgi:choline dehydrogenase-like flavoprotein